MGVASRPHDRLIGLIHGYLEAKRELVDALNSNDAPIHEFRTAIESGDTVGRALARLGSQARTRDAVYAAMRRVEHALLDLRAESIRLLIDEDGLSISEVARISERSRQFTARLYRRAKDAIDADG